MNDVTRRAVVRSAAILPMAAVRGTAANSALRIGLIGAGSRGTGDARTLAKNPDAKVVAICDVFDEQIDKAKASIPAPDAKPYKRHQELLASDVDAVVIATPVFLHPTTSKRR